ncbi:MAG: ABC transporter permease [Anaerolineae bacterium]|nr:ABC transporter permease [Anaerolineae bacterium]MDW8299305.1 ABC transporter permease [Anaerolineae bacterium]
MSSKAALAAMLPKRAAHDYQQRFERWAGWVVLMSALYGMALLVRVPLLGQRDILPIETGLYRLAESLSMLGVAALLVTFSLADGGLSVLLLRGARIGYIVAGRAWAGIALSLLYYATLRDFGGALLIGAHSGMLLALLSRNSGVLLAYPSLVWLGVFFVLPLFGVVAASLGQTTELGLVDLSAPSLANYQRLIMPVGVSGLVYVNIFVRTVWIAFLTTVICMVIGYPFAFWIARQPERWRNIWLMLVMIPFWTNLLIRTYAWVIILRRDGVLNSLLIDLLGVISRPLDLLNTPFALLLGLVYGYLPFMVLPLYQSIERLDKRMIEAAQDLYADPVRTFWRVIFPLTLPGVVAGSILVFIPAVGTYVVSNVLGGGRFFLIGNLLEQQFIGAAGDKAFGAAFGAVLTVLMLIATLVYFRLGRKVSYT